MGFAGAKGLEPSISGVTGQRDNQLRYAPVIFIFYKIFKFVSIAKEFFLANFLTNFSLGNSLSMLPACAGEIELLRSDIKKNCKFQTAMNLSKKLGVWYMRIC